MRLKLIAALLAVSATLSIGNVDTSNEVNLVNNAKQDLYVEIPQSVIATANKSVVSVLIYDAYNAYLGLGSGVIIKEDSRYQYILTNNHVVEEGKIFDVLAYDYEQRRAVVMGTNSTQDCAVIRVDKFTDGKVATLGNSDDVVVGEEVFAIGTPASMTYKNSVTRGIVSGVNRCATSASNILLENQKHAIAVDLAINPGNSGGGLFNERGELIGINTLKLTSDGGGTVQYEAINLALPINDMLKGANAIIGSSIVSSSGNILYQGSYTKTSLGQAYFYSLVDMSLKEKNSLGIPLNLYQGVYVRNIITVEDNPLFTKGINEGSIIVSLNGKNVFDKVTLRQLVYDHNIGDEVSLGVYRKVNGKYQLDTIKINLVGYEE